MAIESTTLRVQRTIIPVCKVQNMYICYQWATATRATLAKAFLQLKNERDAKQFVTNIQQRHSDL